jgi:hypothetical protein
MNEKQRLAYDAFMVGVNWTLNSIIKCGDIYGMTEEEAEKFRERARKIVNPAVVAADTTLQKGGE